MEEKILRICNDLCKKDISVNEQLIISGLLDSFKIMELICNLEMEFDITLLPNEISNIDNFSDVNHIASLVNMKINQSM